MVTTINGLNLRSCTIDGQEVIEITVDGHIVFRLPNEPRITMISITDITTSGATITWEVTLPDGWGE